MRGPGLCSRRIGGVSWVLYGVDGRSRVDEGVLGCV